MKTLLRFNMLCAMMAAAFMIVMAPAQRAEALSLINPGAAPTAKFASEGFTEVRGRRGGGRRFGGGGRRFGGFNRGFRRGGFGYRRNFGYRPARFYRPRYYGAGYRRCRVVLTYNGPVRVCRPRRFY